MVGLTVGGKEAVMVVMIVLVVVTVTGGTVVVNSGYCDITKVEVIVAAGSV